MYDIALNSCNSWCLILMAINPPSKFSFLLPNNELNL